MAQVKLTASVFVIEHQNVASCCKLSLSLRHLVTWSPGHPLVLHKSVLSKVQVRQEVL